MNSIRCSLMICSFIMVCCTVGSASDDTGNIQIEPIVGYGYAAQGDNRGMGYHAGVRVLSNANPTKRWGGEITYISPFGFKDSLSHKNYVAAGIILQAVVRELFVATIGTLGYIGVDQNKNNPFGLVADLGWEPKLSENTRLFVALRTESIYDTSTVNRYSLSLGIKF